MDADIISPHAQHLEMKNKARQGWACQALILQAIDLRTCAVSCLLQVTARLEEEALRPALPEYDALVDADNSITSSQAEVSRLQRVQARMMS